MQDKDLIIDVFFQKERCAQPTMHTYSFVRIKHRPSGITVTKCGQESQYKIKKAALGEIRFMVDVWER